MASAIKTGLLSITVDFSCKGKSAEGGIHASNVDRRCRGPSGPQGISGVYAEAPQGERD